LDNSDKENKKQNNIEQSRMLWIILSALTIIAVVVGAGIFLYFPKTDNKGNQPQLSSFSTEQEIRDFDPVAYVRNAEGYPEMVNPSDTKDEFSVDSGNSIDTNDTPEEVTDDNKEVTEPAEEQSQVQPVVQQKSVEKPVVEKPVAAPVQTIRTTPQTMKVSVQVYWIQVASYKEEIKAKEIREYLQNKDISSEIQTKAVDNNTYYRVRIGSFKSKGEANRFLEGIQLLDGFEDSYVTQTTMVKEVPVN